MEVYQPNEPAISKNPPNVAQKTMPGAVFFWVCEQTLITYILMLVIENIVDEKKSFFRVKVLCFQVDCASFSSCVCLAFR